MNVRMLASDKVVLLLALVPYLREHGPTPVADLARTFDVPEDALRKLVSFLGTAGIPGETLSYQHNDLFDIDWDAFEMHDIVSLTHTVAIDETPRFTGAETAALLAGLHGLRPMLTREDARIAESLAHRLGTVMTGAPQGDGAGSGERNHDAEDFTLSVTVGVDDYSDAIPVLLAAIESESTVRFQYRDLVGNVSTRTVTPTSLTEREGVWYLRGFNAERGADRTFRLAHLSNLETLETSAQGAYTVPSGAESEPSRTSEIVAEIPTRLLPAIRGFAPDVLKVAGLPDDRVRVRIETWHPGAAVRLAQHAPGAIEIVSPPAARAAVSDWAERALAQYLD